MILVSGFNVYPNEIEDAVSLYDEVKECAAVGVIDDKSGEAVKLFVVPAGGNVTIQDNLAYCREQMTVLC